MSDPRISRLIPDYRFLTLSSEGWVGIPQGSWIIHPESLVRSDQPAGAIKPMAANTGVTRDRSRSVQFGSVTFQTPNQQFRDVDFYGPVRCLTTGLKFYNCGFYGSTAWPNLDISLVDCRTGTEGAVNDLNAWAGIPYFQDCTFRPQRPSYNTDGLVGAYWAYRCNFSDLRTACVVDATTSTRRARARIEQSYVHDLSHWYPTPNAFANYGIDVKSAGDVYIGGNTLEASAQRGDDRNFSDADTVAYPSGSLASRNPLYPDHLSQSGSHAVGAGLRVRQTRTLPFDSGLVIEKNWFSNGLAGAELTGGPYIFRENVFKRNGFYRRANGVRYYIKLDHSTQPVIVGLETNRFEDNELLTVNNLGIQY